MKLSPCLEFLIQNQKIPSPKSVTVIGLIPVPGMGESGDRVIQMESGKVAVYHRPLKRRK